MKRNLAYLNYTIPIYFENKFLHYQKQWKLKLTEVDKPSYILSQDVFGILYLSSKFFQSAPKLELIFSSGLNGFKFQYFAKSLCKLNKTINH